MPFPTQCDRRFQPLLGDFGPGVLESTSDTVYGVWPDLALAFMNSGWFRFAAENRGEPAISRDWPLGRSILETIPEPLLPFFEEKFRRSLDEGRRWEHSYDCSSDEVYRQFRLTAYPLDHAAGLLLVSSLEVQTPQQSQAMPAFVEHYQTQQGVITQCCHCRKFRRIDGQHSWDWVTQWIRHMPLSDSVSHGICESCFGFYYAERKLTGDQPQNFGPVE